MSDRISQWIIIGLLAVSVSPCVRAQQSSPPPAPAAPARNVPRPDDLEPGVNTSAPTFTAPSAVASPGVSSLPGPAMSGPGDKPPAAPKVGKASASGKPPATAPAAASNSGAKGGKAEDHLQLDATQITGNQELPKVLYIVPWKRSDLGDLLGKPANSLLDEVLTPVDRDVFKRENRYYDALKPDASGDADKAAGAAGQGSGDKR